MNFTQYLYKGMTSSPKGVCIMAHDTYYFSLLDGIGNAGGCRVYAFALQIGVIKLTQLFKHHGHNHNRGKSKADNAANGA